jgi:phosphomannomutase
MLDLKIGTSSVRGVVGEALHPELVVNFACAFGTWVDGGPVVIARDPRRSSSMFRSAVIAGLLSSGSEIIDLGVAPTPLVSFAVRELGAAGGISITGSHNDARWNALKFVGPDGALLNAVMTEELLDIWHAHAFRSDPRGANGAIEAAPGVMERYLEHTTSGLDIEAIRSRGFRVAVDFCNGSCGALGRRFLDAIGCSLVPLYEKPSARFSRPPAPTAEHLEALAAITRGAGADIGAGLNVDGDRIAFVTADGTPLSEEHTLPLAAWSRLSRRPGAVVTNLSTSRMVDHIARRHGQTVIRTAVGEGHVVDRGFEEGAALAGEGSGGVAALPSVVTFDALVTLATVLEGLARHDRTVSSVVGDLPTLQLRKGEIRGTADRVYRALEEYRSTVLDGEPDVSDGVRRSWDDAWLHVRASNTEPLLRVIVEADTEERADELFRDAMSIGERAVGIRATGKNT